MIRPLPPGFPSKPFDNVTLHEVSATTRGGHHLPRTVTGDVTVLGGVHPDLLGTVLGNLLVEDSGTACVRGVVAEAVIDALSSDFAG
jgi:hypothetical protein